jgi:integrase
MSAGVPIRQVQDWLGHGTITMTMRYAHLAPGGNSALIGVLDGPGAERLWQQLGNKTDAQ